jgi:hypothetical protein
MKDNLPNVDNIEMIDLPNAAETTVKVIETSFTDEQETQTDMTKREMDGVLKAMTSVKEVISYSSPAQILVSSNISKNV